MSTDEPSTFGSNNPEDFEEFLRGLIPQRAVPSSETSRELSGQPDDALAPHQGERQFVGPDGWQEQIPSTDALDVARKAREQSDWQLLEQLRSHLQETISYQNDESPIELGILLPRRKTQAEALAHWETELKRPADQLAFVKPGDLGFLIDRLRAEPNIDWAATIRRHQSGGDFASVVRRYTMGGPDPREAVPKLELAQKLDRLPLEAVIIAIDHPTVLNWDGKRGEHLVARNFQLPLLALAAEFDRILIPQHHLALSEESGTTTGVQRLHQPLWQIDRILGVLADPGHVWSVFFPPRPHVQHHPELEKRALLVHPRQRVFDAFYRAVQQVGIEVPG